MAGCILTAAGDNVIAVQTGSTVHLIQITHILAQVQSYHFLSCQAALGRAKAV